MRHISVVIHTTHGLIHFPHLTMEVKSASSGTTAELQVILIHDSITVPPVITKTITAFVDHLSEWNTTGTVTPMEKFTEVASLIISYSISKKIDYLFDRASQNEQTISTEQYLLNSNTRMSWQPRGSYPNSDTNSKRAAPTATKRKTESRR